MLDQVRHDRRRINRLGIDAVHNYKKLWTVSLMGLTDHPNFSNKTRELILAPSVTIWVSVVTLWEISIKFGLQRGDMPISGKQALQYFNQAGYKILGIQPEHTIAVEDLLQHHQYPFDRLLVVQALTEPMHLLTHDAMVARYSDAIIHV